MRFGASVWPWRWDTPYDKAIERIGKAGFRATELIAWKHEVLNDYYTPATIKTLRGVLSDNKMELSQFVVANRELASDDPAVRNEALEMFKKGVDVAVQLGAPIINTVTHRPFGLAFLRITDRPHMQTFSYPLASNLDWEGNWNEYIKMLRICADYAQSAGLKYSLEPHPFRYGSNTDGLIRILEAVNSPALGINFDPSHLFPVGDLPNVSIYRLAPHIIHCHFSDNDGETNVHWRPGMGKIDWHHVFQALKDTNFKGVISLEFEDIPGVSRGGENVPGVYKGNVNATAEFEKEYEIGLAYMTEVAKETGLPID